MWRILQKLKIWPLLRGKVGYMSSSPGLCAAANCVLGAHAKMPNVRIFSRFAPFNDFTPSPPHTFTPSPRLLQLQTSRHAQREALVGLPEYLSTPGLVFSVA